MRRFCAILSLIMLLPPSLRAAQPYSVAGGKRDSTQSIGKYIPSLGATALPAALFVTGAIYRDNVQDNNVLKDFRAVKSSPADYIQYSPAALMLGLKACGVEGRSDWKQMLVSDAVSVAVMVAATGGLKYTVRRERPDGSSTTSFPSGHAARAFMTATMLHKEYGETVSPWFSVAGYGAAAATGLMRIRENNHWLGDVLAGAGIGIYSVELGYCLAGITDSRNHGFTESRIHGFAESRNHGITDSWRDGFPESWRFSLSTDFFMSVSNVDDGYGHEYVKPAYSAGIEASYIPWYLGAAVYAGFTRLRWTGSGDIVPSDGLPLPELKTVSAGVAAHIPVAGRLSIDGTMMAGRTMGCRYAFTTSGRNVEEKLPDEKRFMGNVGLSLRTDTRSQLSVVAGIDEYRLVWSAFTIGTRYNLIF